MADPKLVNKWLTKADEDFNFADANLKEKNNFYAQICFHFHQATEKYLKAFIVAYDFEFEKIHNLTELLKTCAKKESSLLLLFDECDFLNDFYIDTRYPVHWPTEYTREKALEARESAYKVGETIRKLLVEDTHA